jgi:uncharacterized damage-inducible protein DinB
MLAYIKKMFAYDKWANHRIYNALNMQAGVPHKCVWLFAHLLAAQNIWHGRLIGKASGLSVFPGLTLQQCKEKMSEIELVWGRYLVDISESDLDALITYQNNAGMTFHNSVADILLHILYHGSYHRGQIAQLLRQSGLEPAKTDYIFYVREHTNS